MAGRTLPGERGRTCVARHPHMLPTGHLSSDCRARPRALCLQDLDDQRLEMFMVFDKLTVLLMGFSPPPANLWVG